MKYIPLASFEAINSMLYQVEADGCLMTIRLEAFTCRHTREERRIAADLAQYHTDVQRTPPLSPAPGLPFAPGAAPPALVLGGAPGPAPAPAPAVAPGDIDERLVFFVAALNALYARDGYDFAVLTARDFVAHDPGTVRDAVARDARGFPEGARAAARGLWEAIQGQVLDPAHGCEVYEFRCPSCDPRAATAIFSHHYFFYNKARKVLVVMVHYAEGARYDADDEASPVEEDWAGLGDGADERCPSDPDFDEDGGGKRQCSYGY